MTEGRDSSEAPARPSIPLAGDQVAHILVRMVRYQANAATDCTRHIRIHGRRRPRAVSDRIPVPRLQLQPVRKQERVQAEERRIPSNAATPAPGGIERERPHRAGARYPRDRHRLVPGLTRERH